MTDTHSDPPELAAPEAPVMSLGHWPFLPRLLVCDGVRAVTFQAASFPVILSGTSSWGCPWSDQACPQPLIALLSPPWGNAEYP